MALPSSLSGARSDSRSGRAFSRTVDPIGEPGTVLGYVPDPALHDTRAVLLPGDALVLYTDGITEARAPSRVLEPEELHRALSAIDAESAQGIVDELTAVALGSEGTPPRDDIAVLALRARG